MSELDRIINKAREAQCGGFGLLSTGEKLAAALVLNRADWLNGMQYTLAEAIDQVGADWLALIPEAARRLAYEAEQERGEPRRIKLGSLLRQIGREAGLTDEDCKVFDDVRDKTVSEPVRL